MMNPMRLDNDFSLTGLNVDDLLSEIAAFDRYLQKSNSSLLRLLRIEAIDELNSVENSEMGISPCSSEDCALISLSDSKVSSSERKRKFNGSQNESTLRELEHDGRQIKLTANSLGNARTSEEMLFSPHQMGKGLSPLEWLEMPRNSESVDAFREVNNATKRILQIIDQGECDRLVLHLDDGEVKLIKHITQQKGTHANRKRFIMEAIAKGECQQIEFHQGANGSLDYVSTTKTIKPASVIGQVPAKKVRK